ncbi:MAG TPA: hypothetical protein VG205_11585 [Acidimicrobiales bacterium]|nr:hypothetical protein [Acidimicrobiales bacterium]
MPDDRTTVTELGTALGTLGYPDIAGALARRPAELRIGPVTWERLEGLHAGGLFTDEFRVAFENGRALLGAPDGLRGRTPRIIEWTGGRRAPGDEVAPIDLRIDHVYLISCKYDSDILANTSPARLFEGLLAMSGPWDRSDWFEVVAPDELLALYRGCLEATGLTHLPPAPGLCTKEQHRELREALAGRSYPTAATQAAYSRLCTTVSVESAERWKRRLDDADTGPELMVWRLLRIGSAPYFVLGIDRRTGQPVQYRISSPWDWRDEFEMADFEIVAGAAGQPRVDWSCRYRPRRRASPETGTVAGHIEIRWSHGRFANPPEAKVYLDTPMDELPGYHRLSETEEPQLTLWSTTG